MTHPDTLITIMSMGVIFDVGMKDLAKAEEMYRLALDGHEKSLGKDDQDIKSVLSTWRSCSTGSSSGSNMLVLVLRGI